MLSVVAWMVVTEVFVVLLGHPAGRTSRRDAHLDLGGVSASVVAGSATSDTLTFLLPAPASGTAWFTGAPPRHGVRLVEETDRS
jgi:hypothetical protein